MRRVLLAIFTVLVAGCVPQVARPTPPQVELLHFGLITLDPFSGRAEFDVRLRLSNPNGFALPLLDSTITAELAGSQFKLLIPAIEIPSGGNREVATRLSVPVVEGTMALSRLVSGQNTRFRLLGELQARLGPVTVPVGPFTLVDREVRLDLVFRLPTIRLVDIRLDGLAIRFALEVENPNPIGFTLQGPLRLRIGGNEVAASAFSLGLAPNGKNRGELRLGLTGLPGLGGVSVETDFKASIPGILDRPVAQILQGILR